MNANFNAADFGFQEAQAVDTLWVRAKFDIAQRLNPDRPSWYFLQGEGENRSPVALPQRLTGKLVGLLRKEVTRGGQTTDKLYAFLEISPERRVAIEVGFKTFIARSLIRTAAASHELFAEPVTLTCYTVETQIPTMGVSIRDAQGNKITQRWKSSDDWDGFYEIANANIRLANGMDTAPDVEPDLDAGAFAAGAAGAGAIAPAPVAAPVAAGDGGSLDDIPF